MSFKLNAAKFVSIQAVRFQVFLLPPHLAPNMKVAALALLVAGVASASVESHEKTSVKTLSNLKEATVGEVAAALKLLARERPHQSFLQNDLEEALTYKN